MEETCDPAQIEAFAQAYWREHDSFAVSEDSHREQSADRAQIEAAALANDDVARFGEGKQVRKLIVLPDKLVNVVVA